MVNLRPNNPAPSDPRNTARTPRRHAGRLNLLLTCGGWAECGGGDVWANQLPTLLSPLGVHVLTAGSGREATTVIRDQPVHIAVVDLALPMDASTNPTESRDAGLRILELLARLEHPPPTVVIRRRCTPREGSRGLASALAAGAFAVVDRPIQLETVLDIMRRVVRRHYADQWPDAGTETTN